MCGNIIKIYEEWKMNHNDGEDVLLITGSMVVLQDGGLEDRGKEMEVSVESYEERSFRGPSSQNPTPPTQSKRIGSLR